MVSKYCSCDEEKWKTLGMCDFKDLNIATPKDVYVMPMTDMLVDSAANNELLSFMDDISGYSKILIDFMAL